MTNIDVLENKISAVKKYLKILTRYQKYSDAEISDNLDLQGALERYLYLATQAAIDLADIVISLKRLRKPSSLKESFEILSEENIIPKSLKEELIKMVGFRNVIAHDYEDVDKNIVYDVLRHRLDDIKEFIKIVEKI